MRNMTKSKRKVLIITSIVATFIITLTLIGLTYAYYQATIIWTSTTPKITASVPSGTLKLTFTGSSTVSGGTIYPGWTRTATFKVKNTGTLVPKFNIKFSSAANTIGVNMTYSLTCCICSTTDCGTCTNKCPNEHEKPSTQWPGSATTILSNLTVPVNGEYKYTLTALYKNNTSANQNTELGKNFSGTITIEAAQMTNTNH